MATFDSGRQRYSMNFYASDQRPLQRRSYTGRPSRPAEGQLRVNRVDSPMSALRPLMPQERRQSGHARTSHSCQTRTLARRSFDHFIGPGEYGGWDSKAERVGGLEVDDQLELSRSLNG